MAWSRPKRAQPVKLTGTGGGKAYGGGKYLSAEVRGLQTLEHKLKQLSPDHPETARWMQNVLGYAAMDMRTQMVNSARSAGWGSYSIKSTFGKYKGTITGNDAIDKIFAYTKPGGRGHKLSALAGVTKAGKKGAVGTLFSWRAGRRNYGKPTRTPRKRPPGDEVAMSIATVLEFGSTRYPARPAIRPAVAAAREKLIKTISEGYNEILERIANA